MNYAQKSERMLSADAVRAMLDFRAAHTMSQKELERRCSFPENTVKRLEQQTLAPTAEQLQILKRILDATELTLE